MLINENNGDVLTDADGYVNTDSSLTDTDEGKYFNLGSVLVATDTLALGSSYSIASRSYQWFRSDTAFSVAEGTAVDAASTWSAISGASTSTYTLGTDDAGRKVRVVITLVDTVGNVYTETLQSSLTVNANRPATSDLAVFGEGKVGETLTATLHNIVDADGTPALSSTTYQWQFFDGLTWTDISGATAKTYVIDKAYSGTELRVTTRFMDNEKNIEILASAATATIEGIFKIQRENGVTDIDVADTLTGRVNDGDTLNLVEDISGLTGFKVAIATLKYQWQVSYDGVVFTDIVSLAASQPDYGRKSTFAVTANEHLKYLRTKVSYLDDKGNAHTVYTAVTPQVRIDSMRPEIVGTVKEDSVLTANTDKMSIDPVIASKFTYQWFADGVAIEGATAKTFVPGDAQYNKVITVQVSFKYDSISKDWVNASSVIADVNHDDTFGFDHVNTLNGFHYGTRVSAESVAVVPVNDVVSGDVVILRNGKVLDPVLNPLQESKQITVDVSALVDADVNPYGVNHVVKDSAGKDINGIADVTKIVFSYQWQTWDLTSYNNDGKALWLNVGINSASYIPDDADYSKVIRVKVSYTDHENFLNEVYSSETMQVKPVNDAPIGATILDALKDIDTDGTIRAQLDAVLKVNDVSGGTATTESKFKVNLDDVTDNDINPWGPFAATAVALGFVAPFSPENGYVLLKADGSVVAPGQTLVGGELVSGYTQDQLNTYTRGQLWGVNPVGQAGGMPGENVYSPAQYTYQWQVSSVVDSVTVWTNIVGATSASLDLGAKVSGSFVLSVAERNAYVGKTVRVISSYTDEEGFKQVLTSKASAVIDDVTKPLAPVIDPAQGMIVQANHTAYTVRGTAEAGSYVNVTLTDADDLLLADSDSKNIVSKLSVVSGVLQPVASALQTLNAANAAKTLIGASPSESQSKAFASNADLIIAKAALTGADLTALNAKLSALSAAVGDSASLSALNAVYAELLRVSPIVADANGNWSFTFDVSGLDEGNVVIGVTTYDAAFNASLSSPVTKTVLKDTIVNDETTSFGGVEFTASSLVPVTADNVTAYTVTGTGEAMATVSVLFTDSRLAPLTITKTLTAIVSATGRWSVTADLSTLGDGPIVVKITSVDQYGNTRELKSGTVDSDDALAALVSDPTDRVTGTREELSNALQPNTIYKRVDGAPVAPVITVVPEVTFLNIGKWTVMGTGTPGLTVIGTIGNVTKSAVVDAKGNWKLTFDLSKLPNLPVGEDYQLHVVQQNKVGVTGASAKENRLVHKPLMVQIVEPVAINLGNVNNYIVSGTAEPLSRIAVYLINHNGSDARTTDPVDYVDTDINGNWSTDPESPINANKSINPWMLGARNDLRDGNIRIMAKSYSATTNTLLSKIEARVVKDTKVLAPLVTSKVNLTTDNASAYKLSGKGEAGAMVSVDVDGEIFTGLVDAKGNWTVLLAKLDDDGDAIDLTSYSTDVEVIVSQTDKAGNVSDETTATIINVTHDVPGVELASTLVAIDAANVAKYVVSGTSTVGDASKVTSVRVTAAGITKTVKVAANGDWTATFDLRKASSAQVDVSAVAINALGNSSTPDIVSVSNEVPAPSVNAQPIVVESRLDYSFDGEKVDGASIVVKVDGKVVTVDDLGDTWSVSNLNFNALKISTALSKVKIEVLQTLDDGYKNSTLVYVAQSLVKPAMPKVTNYPQIVTKDNVDNVIFSGTAKAGTTLYAQLRDQNNHIVYLDPVLVSSRGTWTTKPAQGGLSSLQNGALYFEAYVQSVDGNISQSSAYDNRIIIPKDVTAVEEQEERFLIEDDIKSVVAWNDQPVKHTKADDLSWSDFMDRPSLTDAISIDFDIFADKA